MGFYYDITYKKAKDNLVADSLSRTFDDHVSLSSISMPIQIGYTLFSKAMSTTLHYLKSSKSWPVTLLLYCITFGMVLL